MENMLLIKFCQKLGVKFFSIAKTVIGGAVPTILQDPYVNNIGYGWARVNIYTYYSVK